MTEKDLERLLQPKPVKVKVKVPHTTKKYKLGIVSDTHLCDKTCALDELHSFYKRCEKEGITEIVHAGDLTSGVGIYRSQANDLTAWGFEDQLAFCAENYPRFKGKTYFVSGNHDAGFRTEAGANFGKHLSMEREDLVYLGDWDATITLNGVRVGLHHGSGGASYALSYKLQRLVQNIGGGQKPQIYICGHWHASLYMFYRNIHCFLPGCFQKANDLSVRLGLPNTVGGWIVELEVGSDKRHTIHSIKTEYVAYY
jgi:predicted phosphodiesterase